MARGGGGAQGKIENTYCQYDKEGCVFTMIIWSEFHIGQYRDDHRDEAPHFIDASVRFGFVNPIKFSFWY